MNLNDVVFNPKDTNAINFVKARIAIDESLPSREAKRAAKFAVIEHFGGVLKHLPNNNKVVMFPDLTKARF